MRNEDVLDMEQRKEKDPGIDVEEVEVEDPGIDVEQGRERTQESMWRR